MPIQHLDKILKEIENLDFSELKNISSKIRYFSDREQKQEQKFDSFTTNQKQQTDKELNSINQTYQKKLTEQEENITKFFEKQKKNNSDILNQYLSENNTTINTRIDNLSILKNALIEKEKNLIDTINQAQEHINIVEENIKSSFSQFGQQQEKALDLFIIEQKQWNDETIKSIDLTHKKSAEKQEKEIKKFFEKQKNDNSDILNQHISENNTTINTRIDNLTILKNNITEQEQVINKSFDQLQKRMKQSEKNIESSFFQFSQQQEVWQKNVNSMWENSNKMRENSQNLQEKENVAIYQSIKDLDNRIKKDQEILKQQNLLFQDKIKTLSKEISTHTLILDSQKKRLILLGILSCSLIGSLIFILLNQ